MVNVDELAARLEDYNAAYRAGQPLVDDATYDSLVEQLRVLDPQHPYLQKVEPEKFSGRKEVRHPQPMLSLDKAYTDAQLERFVSRVRKEAQLLGIEHVEFEVTPKLDGLAARDDGQVLASRGNGYMGYDITNAFDKGVIALGGRGQGLGEIVVVKSYFKDNLAGKFEHPRNMVVGIVSSDILNQDVVAALEERMVRFVPYRQLEPRRVDAEALLRDIDSITEALTGMDYPMDGVVVSIIDDNGWAPRRIIIAGRWPSSARAKPL